ncbi:MAG: hypothetical protein A2Z04_01300 [Chloroflexi bacterium RBG_16_57_9]|nr:MAG: hypothetical protein A2Z04_01300 [Chloroflexi bacterium RBG_16_57_9]
MSKLVNRMHIFIILFAFCLVLSACGVNTTLKANILDVFRAAGAGNFSNLPLNVDQPLSNGDRVRTSDQGEGEMTLPCAKMLIFGGSNLQFTLLSANGANLNVNVGANEISSQCSNITVNLGNPPEAVVQTSGTAFLVAYNPELHMTLLWTQMGAATLANWTEGRAGKTVTVQRGYWSVVRRGREPEPARPVGEMAPVIREMNLGRVYERVVSLIEQRGFGPGVPTPMRLEKIR